MTPILRLAILIPLTSVGGLLGYSPLPTSRSIVRVSRWAATTTTATAAAPSRVELLESAKPSENPDGDTNEYWDWRGQTIRYRSAGVAENGANAPAVLLVHGLFVNADHWRHTLPALAAAGFRAYAIDLLGNGYSSKPPPTGPHAEAISGETNRPEVAAGLQNVELGTSSGGSRVVEQVDLAHPVQGSVYNFYTWAEQLEDFAADVVHGSGGGSGDGEKVVLVTNSIGTISGLQAAVDKPEVFDGVFVVNPNFRELHTAESPAFIQPAVQAVQGVLRSSGQGLFNALAKPGTVKQILLEPYCDPATVTDDLVDVLLTPLLRPGSADVVFDTLSYSAGPLPEQLLQSWPLRIFKGGSPNAANNLGAAGSSNNGFYGVEICYGAADPWTPPARVDALRRCASVRGVTALKGVGHCPHDERPDLVNPLVVDFVTRVVAARTSASASGGLSSYGAPRLV